jgi:hypothetical protein
MFDSTSKGSPPVAKVRLGAISLSIWENQSQDGRIFYSFNLGRSYQDEAGTWHNTDTFRVTDCMSLVTAIQDAFRWICTEGKRRAREQGQPEDATFQSTGSVFLVSDEAPF